MFTRQLKNFISLLVLILMVNCASQKSYLNKAMQENTIEAYKGFLQKYPNGEYSEKVKKHLIKLEFDKAKNENTIKAYENFLQKYSTSEYSTSAKDEIKEIEKYILFTEIIFSTDDRKRLETFYYNFLKKDVIVQNYNFKLLLEFLDNFFGACKKNNDITPFYIDENCFFIFFSTLEYVPTGTNNLKQTDFKKIMSVLLNEYLNFSNIYNNNHLLEKAFLMHNIGRVACLIQARKYHGDFEKLTLGDMQKSAISSAFQAFGDMSKGTNEISDDEFMREITSRSNSHIELIKLHQTCVLMMLDILKNTDLELGTKFFILKKLMKWVELVNIGKENKAIISDISKNDNNPQIRNFASNVLKNSKF